MQGRLVDGTNLVSGPTEIVFEIFTAPTGGVPVYVETQMVHVVDGLYSARIGTSNAIPGTLRAALTNDICYLGMQVEQTPLSPREQLTTAPYAFRSGASEDGVPPGFFILGTTLDPPPGYAFAGFSVKAGGDDTWATKTPMPSARESFAAAVVTNRIYAIGGEFDMDNQFLTTHEMYDPATDTWTNRASLPAGRRFHAATAANGKIYVFGGQNASFGTVGTTYEYDPVADSWTTRASMPTARRWPAAVTVGARIYVIGGQSAGTASSANEAYDPVLNTWTNCMDMPTARQELAVSAVGGKIYAIGGYNDRVQVEVYDPRANTWSTAADLPTGREDLAAGTVVNRIYVIGGRQSSALDTVDIYEPATDTWASGAPMPTSRGAFAVGLVNGAIYAIGGDIGGLSAVAINEEFRPAIQLPVHEKQ